MVAYRENRVDSQRRETVTPLKRANTTTNYHRKIYAESEKIAAVTIALEHERTQGTDALDTVRTMMGEKISKSSLNRWIRDYGDKVKQAKQNNASELAPTRKDLPTIVTETHNSVVARMQNLLSLYLEAAGDEAKIKGASLRDLNIGIGVQFDKLKQAAGISPEIERALKVLEAACQPLGVAPVDAILDLASVYRERAKHRLQNDDEIELENVSENNANK